MFDTIKEWVSNMLGDANPLGDVSQQVEDVQQTVGDTAQDATGQATEKVEEVKNNLPGQE